MDLFYIELTVIIGLAAFLAVLFRYLKQPPILAYILAGVILGPIGLYRLQSGDLINSLAEAGVTLLLFMLGLELKFSALKSVGKTAFLVGLGQIILTAIAAFGLASFLGFSQVESFYISLGLTFSSTILIVKLLSDKRDLNSLYGKISIGILLLQDFFAVVALIILTGFNNGSIVTEDLLIVVLKAIVIFGWVIFLSKNILPKLLNKISDSSEVLFLFSLAWAFGIAALISSPYVGFSLEIGGFLAGLALANSYESFQITARIKPLRDFFITIFFVTLGMGIVVNNLSSILIPGIILILFVILLKPIVVMILLGLFGYRKRTSLFTGITMAQISEFSLITIFMGKHLGHLSTEVISLLTFVGAVTFVISSYGIIYSNYIYKYLKNYLGIFERKNIKEKYTREKDHEDHIILVGAKRMGESVLNALIKNKQNFIVLDFDPDIITDLKNKNIECYFGDIADPDIQELIDLNKAKLLISTITDHEDNLSLLQTIKRMRNKPKIVMQTLEKENALELYKNGADYVVLPHVAGGHHLSKILVDEKHMELIEEYRKKDLDQFSS